jgi:AraC-like DNA-binding protein
MQQVFRRGEGVSFPNIPLGSAPVRFVFNRYIENNRGMAKQKADFELYSRFVAARTYIDNNIGAAFKIKQAADIACVSLFHFNRLFRQYFFISPYQYYLKRKAEEGARLLTKTEISVSEIASQLGFPDIASFTRRFTHIYHVSPTLYRRIERLKKTN